MGSDVILVIVVVTALAFDFTNGFHDTANAIATSVSTRAMSPALRRRDVGGPELRGGVHLAQGRGHRRVGHRRLRRGDDDGRLRRPRRRDRVEPRDLVGGAAVELVARADRRADRLGVRRERPERDQRGRDRREGARAGGGRAGARLRRRGEHDRRHLPDGRQPAPGSGEPRLPAGPDRVRQHVLAGARHERRAEDDGHHHARADRPRQPAGRRASTCRSGSS